MTKQCEWETCDKLLVEWIWICGASTCMSLIPAVDGSNEPYQNRVYCICFTRCVVQPIEQLVDRCIIYTGERTLVWKSSAGCTPWWNNSWSSLLSVFDVLSKLLCSKLRRPVAWVTSHAAMHVCTQQTHWPIWPGKSSTLGGFRSFIFLGTGEGKLGEVSRLTLTLWWQARENSEPRREIFHLRDSSRWELNCCLEVFINDLNSWIKREEKHV